jgi:hypothetical protein
MKGGREKLGEGDAPSLHNQDEDGLEEGGREIPRKSATVGLDELRLLIEGAADNSPGLQP